MELKNVAACRPGLPHGEHNSQDNIIIMGRGRNPKAGKRLRNDTFAGKASKMSRAAQVKIATPSFVQSNSSRDNAQ